MIARPSFFLDENMEMAVAAGAERRGVTVTTASDEGHLGLDAEDHLDFTRRAGFVLVTHDRGFERRHWAGEEHAGILYFAKGTPVGEMAEWLVLVASVFTADKMVNHFQPAG